MTAKKSQKTLGKAESQVLRHVFEQGVVSVGTAAKHFAESHGLARTTVLTVMERLRKKGFLTRRERGGVYEYSAKLPQETWIKQQIRSFVDTTLGGVVSPLVSYLVDSNLSDQELGQLEKVVRGLSEKSKGSKA